MIDRKGTRAFLKGFSFAGILILVAFGIYGVQSVFAQASGNENIYAGQEVANDAVNTENTFASIVQSVGEFVAGPNTQGGEDDSFEGSDNPNPASVDAAAPVILGTTNNDIEVVDGSETYGIEAVDATPYYLVIPAADFINDGYNPTAAYYTFATGMWSPTTSTSVCMMAPAYLPEEVTIAELWGTFSDTDVTYQGSMALYRKSNYSTESSQQMAYISTGTTYVSGYINPGDTTVDYAVVDSPTYSYFVAGCLGSLNIDFVGVRIYYWP